MTNDTQVKQETGDWSTVKALTREWLTTNAIALTGVNGEVSRSTVNRFKLALQRAIVDLLATVRREERKAALNENAESIINEAGKVGQLMDLASASARKEERSAIKSMLEDYFKHFFCTCHGSTRTGGHFASCPVTIRDEVLGRLTALEASANQKGEVNG